MTSILVIGDSHIDVVAEYDSALEGYIDKPGIRIEYAIGGTAFNIADNLRRLSPPETEIRLISAIKEGALSSLLIRKEIERMGINYSRLLSEGVTSESGYIAHWSGGQLKSAVSCSSIEQAVIRDDEILSDVGMADIVAIDTNLAEEQIRRVRNLCRQSQKPLLIGCVSESKVRRILLHDSERFCPKHILVCMNGLEALSFFGKNWEDRFNPKHLCDVAHAENLIVTNSSAGFIVYTPKQRMMFSSPVATEVVSELGAGDALFSACCDYYANHRAFDWNDCYKTIQKYVIPILRIRQATVTASAATARNGAHLIP